MSEITIALDAGHGGSDSGAVYKSRKEKDDTLRLTRAVGQILENSGINVYYVREDDEYETPFKKATDANKAVLARNINEELEKAGFKNLGVTERPNLVVLKRTKMPAVLIEAGFINDDEDNRIFDENFNKIAQAIADGILKTLYAQDINFNEIPDYVQNMPEPEAFNGTYQGDAQDTTLPPSPATRPGMNVPYRMQNPMEDNDPEKLYRVQVGSFRDKSNAERMLNSLLMEGFPAFMIYEDGLYKVQVGAFRYLSNAIKMERRLRCFRYSTFIVYN